MSKENNYNFPLDVPSIKEQGLVYEEDSPPGAAKWMSPTTAQQNVKGNILDTKPWAKSSDSPKQGTPFRNLRQR